MNVDVMRLVETQLKFRFSLSSMLLLVIPIAFLSLYIHYRLNSKPIEFREFTWESMEQELAAGNDVILYCHPTYAVGDSYTPHQFLDSELRRSFHEGSFVAMKLKYSDWSGAEINNIFKRVGHTKCLMIILFQPGHTPERIDGAALDNWFDRIARPSHIHYLYYLGGATVLLGLGYSIRIGLAYQRRSSE